MTIEGVLDAFCKEIARCDHILTEDSVRYIFFACMLKQDDDMNHYILELPYQRMDGKGVPIVSDTSAFKEGTKGLMELDMFYQNDVEAFCFEFKFHRTGDKRSAFAHPQAAGGLFNDLRRLQQILPSGEKCVRKIMVYLTDPEMDQYLGQPSNSYASHAFRMDLKEFYELSHIGRFVPMTIRAANNVTFRNAASNSFKELPEKHVTITGIDLLYKRDNIPISEGCSSFAGTEGAYLRIYEVK